MKQLFVFAFLLLLLSNVFAQEKEIWRNPEIFAINKEAAHAEFILFENRDEAIAPLNLKAPWSSSCYQSMNGEWDFNWYGNYKSVPEDWYATNTKVEKWGKMLVPGTWQLNGYDRLYYVNVTMPFEYSWETGEVLKEFVGDAREQSKETGYIPDDAQTIGCYRKWVEIPEERLNNRIVLRIGAVEAGVHVFVNGKEAGYSQGSMTPAEFEISKYLTKGKNLISLKVFRWTDGSYLEVQDMIRFTGIYRDVFLRFEPKQQIKNIKFIGTPSESLSTVNASYEILLSNENENQLANAKLKFEILPNGEGKSIKSWTEEITSVSAKQELKLSGNIELKEAKLWSPDQPNLYTLLVSLFDEKGNMLQITRSDVGFKRFEHIDGNLHLNGKRYFIKGVNRHDHHAKYGKYVPVENMIRDLEIMKQNNINTVRTSHYPNDERWYYLCNRYGMALINEANVESHNFHDVPGNRPQWLAAAVDRIESVVERDKNHPSVFIWSLGNEQGWGWSKAFDAQFDKAKEIDDSRMVMCDRGNYNIDYSGTVHNPLRLDKPNTVSPMYHTIQKSQDYLDNRENDKRPFFMCEYRHAMGNSVGALKEVWDMIYANENSGLNGGCIWDWMDQGVEALDKDGTTYYQYGGDWGDEINSRKNFCLNGLIMSDQSWTPKLEEVKKCYEPLRVEAISVEEGQYEVLNQFNQIDMSQIKTTWELRENGEIVQKGEIKKLNAAPLEKASFEIPYKASNLKAGKEYTLRIGFELKDDTKWAVKGHEITFSEFELKGDFNYSIAQSDKVPSVVKDDKTIQISTDNGVQLSFNKVNGLLSSLNVKGKELLATSDRDFLFDYNLAWIDNYYRNGQFHLKEYQKLMLEDLKRTDETKVTVEEQNKSVVVIIKNTFMSPEEAGYTETQTWTIDGLGQIILDEHLVPIGKLTSDVWIPRIGLRIPLKPELNQMSYYGLGPHGNYPDRKYGSWTGIHTSTVANNYVPYPKPQDHGNREQVRWMTITDESGVGLKVIAPKALSMSALPYTQKELQNAAHTIDLPKQSTTTEFRVAPKVSGLGNGSCGPPTDMEYRTMAEETKYRVIFVPVN